MRRNNILGILLVVLGAIFLLKAFDVFDITSIAGWWTLFLLVPGFYSMSKQGVTVGNTILVIIGVAFLLDAQGIQFKGYLIPAILIVLGLAIIVKK